MRTPARVVPVPKCLYESAPDSLKKSGALMYFHNLCGVPATLEDPADSEAVQSVPVLARQGCAARRSAVQKHVESPRKQAESDSSSFSGGENIREL